jgi:hypothetical protein
MSQGGSRRILAISSLAVFIVAFGLQLRRLGAYDDPLYGESVRIARSLAAGCGFANPYRIATGASAHMTPGIPAIQAAAIFATASEPGARRALVLFAMAVFSVGAALLPWLAWRLGTGMLSGVLGGLVWSATPIHSEMDPSWLQTLTSLAAILLLAFAARLKAAPSIRKAVELGAFTGLALLCNPVLAAPALGMAVVLLGFGVSGRHVGVACAVACLVLTPWMTRNRNVLGAWMLRSNLGLELSVSNADGARPDMQSNSLSGSRPVRHPYQLESEARRVAALGEARYNRERWAEFSRWVRTNPGEFLSLTAARARLFWLHGRNTPMGRLMELGFLAGGIAGLMVLWGDHQKRFAAVLLGTIGVTYPLMYYVIQASGRYSAPIRFVPALLLGALCARAAGRKRYRGPEGGRSQA